MSQVQSEDEIIDELHSVVGNDVGLWGRMITEIPGHDDDTELEVEYQWVRDNRAACVAVHHSSFNAEQQETHLRRYGW